MVSANVIKGVQKLLEDRGIQPEPDETFEDTLASVLSISRRQSDIFLVSLHDGATFEAAAAAAEIDNSNPERDFLIRIARAIGCALGAVNKI